MILNRQSSIVNRQSLIQSETIGLSLLLLLELFLFSGSFNNFFNHDTLFYLVHYPRSWQEFSQFLVAPDPARQYRPLTLGMAGLLVPYLGLDPRPYHVIPIIFHLLNTVLFYCLARRLMPDSLSILAAVGFWGLHSVAGWITYDMTCLPDFLVTFFLLASLILAVDGQIRKSPLRLAGSFAIFICALLTKEVAIMFPLALLICLGLAGLPTSTASAGAVWQSFKKALPLTSIYLIAAVIHAVLLFHWLRKGLLYTQGAAAAYDISPWANLSAKAKYLYWALNLPDTLHIPRAAPARFLALAALAAIGLLLALGILRGTKRLPPVVWAGLIWFAGLNLPALMLSRRLAKWYLYVPLLGLALVFGSLGGRLRGWLPRLRESVAIIALLPVLLIPYVFSSAVQIRSYLVSSDAAYGSEVLQNCLRAFREANPTLPPRVTLFWLSLPEFEKNIADLLTAPPIGNGELFELYYPKTKVQMLFADKGARLPEDYFRRGDVRVLQYMIGHLNDVTEYYGGRRRASSARRVIRELENIHASVSRDEFYPTYDRFLTPGGKPIFFPTPDKDIFTQIGGSTAAIQLDRIEAGAVLRFDVSWMFDGGDGGWAELRLRVGEKESVLYQEYMNPTPKGKSLPWKEVSLDLTPFAAQKAGLILRCYNSAGHTTVADWLNWRDMVLEQPSAKVSN